MGWGESAFWRCTARRQDRDEKSCAMTVGHRVERQHKPQGSQQTSSMKGKPQSHAPRTTMRTGPLSKQSHSPVTSSGTPTSTTQAQHGHPALEMSFRNLSLDSILEGEHGQPRLLQRPSDAPHIPLLGGVLTVAPLLAESLIPGAGLLSQNGLQGSTWQVQGVQGSHRSE